LVRAVDDQARTPASDRHGDGTLYGVRAPAGEAVELVELARGPARRLPLWARPPAGLTGIALATGGWAAPMEDDGSLAAPPSQHRARRRVHLTILVAGDGQDVAVLRYPGEEPQLIRGALGPMADRLKRCWRRRSEAVVLGGAPADGERSRDQGQEGVDAHLLSRHRGDGGEVEGGGHHAAEAGAERPADDAVRAPQQADGGADQGEDEAGHQKALEGADGVLRLPSDDLISDAGHPGRPEDGAVSERRARPGDDVTGTQDRMPLGTASTGTCIDLGGPAA
jgi:hypothetical protein